MSESSQGKELGAAYIFRTTIFNSMNENVTKKWRKCKKNYRKDSKKFL